MAEIGEAGEQPVLNVTGHGEIFLSPEIATIRLGVLERASTAAEAQGRANSVIQTFRDMLSDLGIGRDKVETSRLTLSCIQEGAKAKVVAYLACIKLGIQLSEVGLAGKVVDAAMTAGINTIDGIEFGLKDRSKQSLKAYNLAVADAKLKAETVAKALDMKLACVSQVMIGATPCPGSYRVGGVMAGAMMDSMIDPDEVKVEADVTIEYRLG